LRALIQDFVQKASSVESGRGGEFPLEVQQN
jgi:hypothetical protein